MTICCRPNHKLFYNIYAPYFFHMPHFVSLRQITWTGQPINNVSRKQSLSVQSLKFNFNFNSQWKCYRYFMYFRTASKRNNNRFIPCPDHVNTVVFQVQAINQCSLKRKIHDYDPITQRYILINWGNSIKQSRIGSSIRKTQM